MADLDAIYFYVWNRDTNVCGYWWRLGWGATSFYIKPKHDYLTALKISLHGYDAAKGVLPGFKIGIDSQSATDKARDTGGGLVDGNNMLPLWFSGEPVTNRSIHVLRIRTSWDLFVKGVPHPGHPPTPPKARQEGNTIDPPKLLGTVDVDVFVTNGRPWWPKEDKLREARAMLGPLRHNADEYLTASVMARTEHTHPTPPDAYGPEPIDPSDRVRGLGYAVDPTGFLWVREQFISRQAMLEQSMI